MRKVAADCEVLLVEIGGTVGDIESLPFLEAIRQMRQDLAAIIPSSSTSPSSMDRRRAGAEDQAHAHSVKEMLSIGIQPDILLCRSDRAVPTRCAQDPLFCNVQERAVIAARDVASIYELP